MSESLEIASDWDQTNSAHDKLHQYTYCSDGMLSSHRPGTDPRCRQTDLKTMLDAADSWRARSPHFIHVSRQAPVQIGQADEIQSANEGTAVCLNSIPGGT